MRQVRVTGSRTRNTYNYLQLPEYNICNFNFWGQITTIIPEPHLENGFGMMVCINGTDIFLHGITEVNIDDGWPDFIEFEKAAAVESVSKGERK